MFQLSNLHTESHLRQMVAVGSECLDNTVKVVLQPLKDMNPITLQRVEKKLFRKQIGVVVRRANIRIQMRRN